MQSLRCELVDGGGREQEHKYEYEHEHEHEAARGWLRVGRLLLAVGVAVIVGCQPAPPADVQPKVEPTVKVSEVPLRIRVVGSVDSPEVIERRWLSGSEQPIEIQSQSVAEFLAGDASQSDIILFPARLIGELVQRDWITKLPTFESQAVGADEEEASRGVPPAWQAQCIYGGVTYAIPLGYSLSRFVASESLAEQLRGGSDDRDPTVAFQQWIDAVTSAEAASGAAASAAVPPAATVQADEVDAQALVDRFLTLAFAATKRNPQYGVVLDLETMNPRLTEAEFLQAAELLLKLSAQADGGRQATLGSHAAAWKWAATHAQPVVSIASVAALSPEAATIASGAAIELSDGAVLNTGGGLIAAMATECRQTQQSKLFLQWLREPQTAAVLAPLVRGVDSPQPVALDSLSWRVQQRSLQVALNDQLPQELRIPGTFELREELAEELLAMLSGSKTAVEALEAAQQRWAAIIGADRDAIKREYQFSLGLKEQ